MLYFFPCKTSGEKTIMKKFSNKGMTLCELMIAALILAFSLTGFLSLFSSVVFLNSSSRDNSKATAHAQQILEEIEGFQDFTQLETNIDSGYWNLDQAKLSAEPYSFSLLRDESIVTDVFQSGNPLGVSVTVNWTERNGRPRNLRLITLRTNYR